MAWSVECAAVAAKELGKLDKAVAKRIVAFLRERAREDPRALGGALKGPKLGEFWKYRVGDYRVICVLEDAVLRVLVVRIGNRREMYR